MFEILHKIHLTEMLALKNLHSTYDETFMDFYITVPSWWNDLPNSIQAAESLIFSRNA